MIMTNGLRLLVNVGTYKYIILLYCFKVKLISVWTPRIVWYPILCMRLIPVLRTAGQITIK